MLQRDPRASNKSDLSGLQQRLIWWLLTGVHGLPESICCKQLLLDDESFLLFIYSFGVATLGYFAHFSWISDPALSPRLPRTKQPQEHRRPSSPSKAASLTGLISLLLMP